MSLPSPPCKTLRESWFFILCKYCVTMEVLRSHEARIHQINNELGDWDQNNGAVVILYPCSPPLWCVWVSVGAYWCVCISLSPFWHLRDTHTHTHTHAHTHLNISTEPVCIYNLLRCIVCEFTSACSCINNTDRLIGHEHTHTHAHTHTRTHTQNTHTQPYTLTNTHTHSKHIIAKEMSQHGFHLEIEGEAPLQVFFLCG